MRRLFWVLLLLPYLFGQSFTKVIHLSPQEARAMKQLWEEKQLADARWKQAVTYVTRKYTMTPAVAQAGNQSVAADSVAAGWQNGIEFSPDFEVGVPKEAPKKTGCTSTEQ